MKRMPTPASQLDPQFVADALRRARVLRAQAFTRALLAVWRAVRSRIDAARRAQGRPLGAGA